MKTRGRPKNKPGYDRESQIQMLINTATELAVEPFDESIERDENLPTLTEIADQMETTLLRIRKLLITAEYYSSETAREVQRLKSGGRSINEIMIITGLGKASVYSYLPYNKGAYNLQDPTLYSEQGKRYRTRKAAVKELADHMNTPDELDYLWKCVVAFSDYPFATSGRGKDRTGSVKFRYEVSRETGNSGRKYSGASVDGYGNEIWLLIDGKRKEKSISRSTVDLSYKNGLKLMNTEGYVSGPKALGIPGAGSYLYPVLLRFGVIRENAEE